MRETRPSAIARLAGRLRVRREERDRRIQRRRWAPLLAMLCVFLLLAAVALPFTKAHLQATAVLDLVGNKPMPWLLQRVVSTPVSTMEITIPNGATTLRARLYAPVNNPNAPSLVVLHGVHHLGMNEPRLIAFASAMASCGLRVLTPELPDIADYHIGPNSIAAIGASATYLAKLNGDRPVGVMGLSFSGGLSLLAASDPQFQPAIKFVVAIGSQDAMSRVAQYYRTGGDVRPDGTNELLPPHEYGALVLEYQHLEDFVPQQDIEPIRLVLRTHLYEQSEAEKAAYAALTPPQSAEAKMLMDTSNPGTRAALAREETLHVEDMAGISPHGHLHTLTTPVYLLHGEGDNIIPAAETMWMADELPSETLQASLITPVLSHINLDGHDATATDQLRLVHFFALILHAAESR